MDNCLASNSETGGVGCDNMTMSVIGLLNGKTKEQWYESIAKRVSDGDGPCAPPEYGKFLNFPNSLTDSAQRRTAEFRGPGVHHNFDDSDSGYEVEDRQGFGGNSRGRIILLGDGSEVLTNSDDSDMFDHADEDEDLQSQVKPSSADPSVATPENDSDAAKADYKGIADEALPAKSNNTEESSTKSD